jgi:hypothetical protein
MGWLRRTLSCLRRPTHAHASHGAAMTEVLFLPAGENWRFISKPPCIFGLALSNRGFAGLMFRDGLTSSLLPRLSQGR